MQIINMKYNVSKTSRILIFELLKVRSSSLQIFISFNKQYCINGFEKNPIVVQKEYYQKNISSLRT